MKEKIAVGAGFLIILVGALVWMQCSPKEEDILIDIEEPPDQAVEATADQKTLPQIRVEVIGAVKNPGDYEIDIGSSAKDAITAAGGLTADRNELVIEYNHNDKEVVGYKLAGKWHEIGIAAKVHNGGLIEVRTKQHSTYKADKEWFKTEKRILDMQHKLGRSALPWVKQSQSSRSTMN